MVIQGSFDPNDKRSTTQLSPAEVTTGKYVDYTIRFQNTGTDTAFNIVISDTLSNQLVLSSLELVNSSHSCSMSEKENIIYFEFKNILLPDSNANELKSHGFVQFRIKPRQNLPLNTIIENRGNIYFDYNAPVITNTAFTIIKEPGQVYIFTGNGNWNTAANWKNYAIPPSSIQHNEAIIIDPPANGSCVLNVPENILPGASLTVQKNKKFVVQGNLTVQ